VFVVVAIGPGGVAADVANTQFSGPAVGLINLANPAPGSQSFGPFRHTAGSNGTFGVVAIAAGTAGVVYAVNIIATRLE